MFANIRKKGQFNALYINLHLLIPFINMNLVQIKHQNFHQVAVVVSESKVAPLAKALNLAQLAQYAIERKQSLHQAIEEIGIEDTLDYSELLAKGLIAAPISHNDPAHVMVSGTGLTHLGSAATRNAMHKKASANESTRETENITDSMRMFQMGLKGGKPASGEIGVQPEWFYKGQGNIVRGPGETLVAPSFAEDGSEEPEIAGIYLIGEDKKAYRIGFVLGNEFSDHIMEKQNYLYLAHSKLRQCAIGPELLVGELPSHIEGISRVVRDSKVIWEKPFLSGEENMSHTIENLEYHHFKYAEFLQPGDIHIHFFGTATLSFADGIKTQAGDRFEIEAAPFGRALSNTLAFSDHNLPIIQSL